MPEITALPDPEKSPTIFGYEPNNIYDRNIGARQLGYADEADLIANGTSEQIAALDAQEASWQANNDQISDWLEDHVKTSIAVHDLVASVAALEDRVTAQAARIRALEAAAGITSA